MTDMFPGSYPFEELEAALRRVEVEDPGSIADELRSGERGLLRLVKRILPGDDSELVLVIDQFEELFSMVDEQETRRLFLDALTALVTDVRRRVRVVVTLRADFFDRPLEYPAFGELLKEGLVTVTSLDDGALVAVHRSTGPWGRPRSRPGSSEASIKAVQRMLGHASAKMTLDVYGSRNATAASNAVTGNVCPVSQSTQRS